MTVRRELRDAVAKADTCGMDERQVADVVETVLNKLLDRLDSRHDGERTGDWLRDVRDGMR